MMFFKFLKFLDRGNYGIFSVEKEKMQMYIDSLPEPKDYLDRSFFQYKCQSFFWKRHKIITFNLLSLTVIPIVLLLLMLKSLFTHYKFNIKCISDLKNFSEVIPDELINKYDIDYSHWCESMNLRHTDIKFIFTIFFRYPLNPFFLLKSIIKIALYRNCIDKYSVKAFIMHTEYSFTSSLLTYFCHLNNVQHINVMHGEKLYNIRDSFFCFDKCYIWDEHYKDLFINLRADPNQFIVSIPPSLKIVKKRNPECNYKYYLAKINKTQLLKVIFSMNSLKESGNIIKYRPHPRYTDLSLIKEYINENEIEYPNEVHIIDSIANTDNVIGSYSTVLLQAYFSNIDVILDDIAFNDNYKKLKELNYILNKKNCIKLSSLLSTDMIEYVSAQR